MVASSVGHIRDLPAGAEEIPPEYRGEPWARLGVNVDQDFEPLYVISPSRKKQVAELKRLLKDASEVYLATDEDREGEAIAWHLKEVLTPSVPVRRMVFHEITPKAIEEALSHTRDIDDRLVDAQETRRILDRLYGYEVSPVLWKKVQPKLSAGRVQSVAVRLVVQRERERMAFRSATFYDLLGRFVSARDGELEVTADLQEVDGLRVARGSDFDAQGRLKNTDTEHLDEEKAARLAAELQSGDASVISVEKKPYRRKPQPPFITSTLQQEAARRLGFSAAETMRLAQSLYERGYITYMRTDSVTLSSEAIEACRAEILSRFGAEVLPRRPREWKNRVRNAQEAHEAIRPAGERFRSPEEVAGEVGTAEARLYELIWRRTIASQMEDAKGETVTVRIKVSSAERTAVFVTSGTVITFPAYRLAYEEHLVDDDAGRQEGEADAGDGTGVDAGGRSRQLPPLEEGDRLEVRSLDVRRHETKPPPRYTEASLIRTLEENGIGRPSTYATIMSTIQERGYVRKVGSALVPTWTAFAVVQLLERHFSDLVDEDFTARMEEALDAIARGEAERVPYLRAFYFGGEDRDQPGLRSLVDDERLGDIDPRAVNAVEIGKTGDGETIYVRVGRFGPYLECGDRTAPLPDSLTPDQLTVEVAESLLETPPAGRMIGEDPDTRLPVLLRTGRFGPYLQLGEDAEGDKPKRVSLPKSIPPEAVDLDLALRLLSLPRELGRHPDTDEPVEVHLGRYGPYIRCGSETRSISEEDLFEIDLDTALRLLAEPRAGRGRRTLLRSLGEDLKTGRTVELRSGRYGPYVTDGEVNASVGAGVDLDALDLEAALELLAAKRARASSVGTGSTKAKGRKSKAAAGKSRSRKGTKKAVSSGRRGAKADSSET